ncbi:MAG: radical SAM protein [Euryarchaeota archaeon]|nr:radical SAM protein [Euryarchaeota archaeon]
MSWLVIDGYEDEPAAFGVPPYVGFHIRYICGVLESHNIEYDYVTIDEWRVNQRPDLSNCEGIVILAGAVVPGKYLRGTPISLKETNELLKTLPRSVPLIAGGWAIRGWRQQGWTPLRANLFLCVQDTDATLDFFLNSGELKHRRRTAEQWNLFANLGASSKAVTQHPDLFSLCNGEQTPGPLTYEVEVYQGCVRYKRGCKFCIEPKKGVPLWRTPEQVIDEVSIALDSGVTNIRLGGMTDIYTYMAEGVVELEYPIPNPEPIAKLLHGLRDDGRIEILHTDNANPSIIAENLEPADEITRTLCDTLSDGGILSFGLESADPAVHEANWLNCDTNQLKTAIRHINQYGRERGERGLPKLLPGLNFISGLNGETAATYDMNRQLLRELKEEGLWLRRINIRQVQGEGFQDICESDFNSFKQFVRNEIDEPLLSKLFPLGQLIKDIRWESHDGRIRLPSQIKDEGHRSEECRGNAGVTFGRQVGAYPILVGLPYHAPLESVSDAIVTGHGKRSITAVEVGININMASQKQLEAVPGIGENIAWRIISERVKRRHKGEGFKSVGEAFDSVGIDIPEIGKQVLVV